MIKEYKKARYFCQHIIPKGILLIGKRLFYQHVVPKGTKSNLLYGTRAMSRRDKMLVENSYTHKSACRRYAMWNGKIRNHIRHFLHCRHIIPKGILLIGKRLFYQHVVPKGTCESTVSLKGCIFITAGQRPAEVMRKYLFVLLFGFAIAVHAQDATPYLREAEACLNKGDYDCAITKYKAYAELSGENPVAEIKKAESCRDIKQSADKYNKDKDYEKACAEYEKLLKENPGDTYAKQQKEKCCLLSDPLQLGKECYRHNDYEEAVKWFQKSADQGNSIGQNNLGFMYEKGLGVEEDHVEAVRWYTKSAKQGFAIAQYNLGLMYEYGYGVKKNRSEAVWWYTKSANQGNQKAINKLKNNK